MEAQCIPIPYWRKNMRKHVPLIIIELLKCVCMYIYIYIKVFEL